MWLKLHKLPRRYYKAKRVDPQKAKYIKDASFTRYNTTEDGKYISALVPALGGEIGIVDSFRFICAEG